MLNRVMTIGNRWTKGNMDRIYVNNETMGQLMNTDASNGVRIGNWFNRHERQNLKMFYDIVKDEVVVTAGDPEAKEELISALIALVMPEETETTGEETVEENKEDKKMAKNAMTGHERIAAKNIDGAFNWHVGGWYNCLQDGYEEYIPTLEEAKEIVYDEAMNNLYKGSGEGVGKAPKEMRFAGKEFCKAYIEKLFAEDGDAEEIWGNEED